MVVDIYGKIFVFDAIDWLCYYSNCRTLKKNKWPKSEVMCEGLVLKGLYTVDAQTFGAIHYRETRSFCNSSENVLLASTALETL